MSFYILSKLLGLEHVYLLLRLSMARKCIQGIDIELLFIYKISKSCVILDSDVCFAVVPILMGQALDGDDGCHFFQKNWQTHWFFHLCFSLLNPERQKNRGHSRMILVILILDDQIGKNM